MVTPEQEVIRVAASQHGLIGRTQALSLGMTPKDIQVRLDRGRWRAVRPGTYLVGAAPVTRSLELVAACLAAGDDAVASHRAAAWIHGFDGFSNCPTEITVAASRGPRLHRAVVHHTERFDPADRTVVHGVPVTTRERTLLDLGAVVPPVTVEMAIESYFRGGGTTTKLVSRLNAIGGRGCRGVGVARAILENRAPSRPLGSALEVMYKRLVMSAGYWPGEPQCEVDLGRGVRIRIDYGYRADMVAVELQGFDFHTSRRALQRDSERYVLLTRNAIARITSSDRCGTPCPPPFFLRRRPPSGHKCKKNGGSQGSGMTRARVATAR